MSRTNALRELLTSELKKACQNVYFEVADEEKIYPHIVFSYNNIDTGDSHRHDIAVEIDLWDRSTSAYEIEALADEVEDIFNTKNMPQDTILPTFYLMDRKPVKDDDKTIRHRLIRVLVQNYER